MALFKILRGGKASLDSKELHDGWAYFIPSTGELYIDVADGIIDGRNYAEEPDRILVAGGGGGNSSNIGSAYSLDTVLIPEGWADKQYALTPPGVELTNCEVLLEFNEDSLPEDITPADRFKAQAAAALADMTASYTRDAVIVTCRGAIPTTNIPVTIILMGRIMINTEDPSPDLSELPNAEDVNF